MLKKLSDYFIYFVAGVGVIGCIRGSFWLMNQPSSYAFYVGLFLLGAVAFLLVNWISSLTKDNKDGE
jgi:pilus assembly protein TadC